MKTTFNILAGILLGIAAIIIGLESAVEMTRQDDQAILVALSVVLVICAISASIAFTYALAWVEKAMNSNK